MFEAALKALGDRVTRMPKSTRFKDHYKLDGVIGKTHTQIIYAAFPAMQRVDLLLAMQPFVRLGS